MNHSFHATALAAATSALREGDCEKALQQTHLILRRFGSPPFPLPVAGGLAKVDYLLDALGQKICREFKMSPVSPNGGDWILATCVYEMGGHTPVMRDLASALPEGLGGIVLTLTGHDAAELTPQALARTGLPAGAIRRADAPTMLETCRNVLRVFESNPPRRLFLFQYPHDTVAVAAAAALSAAGTEIWLVHHADGYPTAGLFLPGLRILDLTPDACAFTRHVLGLRSTWLPLTCPDPGPSRPVFLKRGHLTTALSGSIFKTTQESPHSYPEVVAAVLRATGGTHVHIGPLDGGHRASVLAAIAEAGQRADQFVHIPVAQTLVEALLGESVDLLLNTWPMGGARAAVESMAAGVPIVWHAPHETVVRFRHQMNYPGAAVWRRASDLAALVGRADLQWLSAQSQAARRRYEELHHPSRWHQFFAAPDSATDLPLPAGFDTSRFLPVLWEAMLDHAIDTHGTVLANLRAEMRRQREKLGDLGELKRRLQTLESELKETRFPWLIRLWRQWRKRRPTGKPDA